MFELLLFTSPSADRTVCAADVASLSLSKDTTNPHPPAGTAWRVLLAQAAMGELLGDLAVGRMHQLQLALWEGPYQP